VSAAVVEEVRGKAEEVAERKVSTSIYIPVWMLLRYDRLSKERKVPRTEIIREALQLYLDLCEAGMLGNVRALLQQRKKEVSSGG
jgi:metal-responsive CopG/Arc/MetJ family transcriptional regulator